MTAERFIDTNILIYAYDRGSDKKRDIASELIAVGWEQPGSTAISVQVLLEFFATATRRGTERALACEIVTDLSQWPVIDNTIEIFGSGLSIQQRWQLSLWDAMILAAAKASGATQLITEDLNHGQDYGGIRAINPFNYPKIQ